MIAFGMDDCLKARMIRFANGMNSFGIGMIKTWMDKDGDGWTGSFGI